MYSLLDCRVYGTLSPAMRTVRRASTQLVIVDTPGLHTFCDCDSVRGLAGGVASRYSVYRLFAKARRADAELAQQRTGNSVVKLLASWALTPEYGVYGGAFSRRISPRNFS